MPAWHRERYCATPAKVFTFSLEACSRSAGISVHVVVETLTTMDRNMHYVAIILASMFLPLLSPASIGRFAWYMALGFFAAHPSLWLPTLETPLASRAVYEQQYQMGLIVRDFLEEPIAVNDIGLVAWLGH